MLLPHGLWRHKRKDNEFNNYKIASSNQSEFVQNSRDEGTWMDLRSWKASKSFPWAFKILAFLNLIVLGAFFENFVNKTWSMELPLLKYLQYWNGTGPLVVMITQSCPCAFPISTSLFNEKHFFCVWIYLLVSAEVCQQSAISSWIILVPKLNDMETVAFITSTLMS